MKTGSVVVVVASTVVVVDAMVVLDAPLAGDDVGGVAGSVVGEVAGGVVVVAVAPGGASPPPPFGVLPLGELVVDGGHLLPGPIRVDGLADRGEGARDRERDRPHCGGRHAAGALLERLGAEQGHDDRDRHQHGGGAPDGESAAAPKVVPAAIPGG